MSELNLVVQPAAQIKLALSVGQGPAGTPGNGLLPPFNFATPLSPWVINHNLGRRPLVGAFSVGGVEMFAEILHINTNQVTITFDSPTAGFAIVS